MRKSGIVLVIIGCMLIITSFGLAIYNNYENKQAGIKSNIAFEKIQETFNREELVEDTNKEMKIVDIDGYGYIGTISIPTLGLNLPIMSDWDNERMKISPCRYYGSIYTNDLVICSHSYDNLLGNIYKLNQGDLLVLTDMYGQEFVYEVKVVEVLGPDDVKEMIESEFDLTLYTCTKDNLNRVTVRLNKLSN